MICLRCGSENPETSRFCVKCGDRLEVTQTYSADTNENSGYVPVFSNPPVCQVYETVNEGGLNTVSLPVNQQEAIALIPEKKRHSVAAVIIAIVFGFLSFVLALYGLVALPVSGALSENKVSESFRQSKPAEVLLESLSEDEDFRSFLDENFTDIVVGLDDTTPSQFFDYAVVLYVSDEDDLSQFLEEMEMMDLLTEIVRAYEDYLCTGNCMLALNKTKLKRIITDLRDPILEYSDYDIEYDMEYIESVIDSNISQIKKLHPSETIGEYSSFTSFMLNPVVIIAALAVVIIFIIVLAIIGRNPVPAFISGGIPMIIDGVIGLLIPLISDTTLTSVGVKLSCQRQYILDIISPITNEMMIYSLVFLCIGVILLISAVILSIIRRRTRAR